MPTLPVAASDVGVRFMVPLQQYSALVYSHVLCPAVVVGELYSKMRSICVIRPEPMGIYANAAIPRFRWR